MPEGQGNGSQQLQRSISPPSSSGQLLCSLPEAKPVLDFPITVKTLILAVCGTRDLMPYHHDPDYSKSVGNRDMFVNTMFEQALFGRYVTDFVVEFPYSDPPQKLEGFDAYRTAAGAALDIFRFRLELVHVHEGMSPDGLVAEYVSDGVALPTGKPYRNVYVGVFAFRDGKLAGLREYWNPAIAAEALTPD